jgi:cyclopropane fatty-acyl-phospholipid synthase-like methyltransferase
MLDNSRLVDKFLQNYRFKKARPFLIGDVLDFGGNRGELKKYVAGKYLAVNYDHSAMVSFHFDTIVCLAVLEHLKVAEAYEAFKSFKNILNKNGRIVLTTPAKAAKPVLEWLARFRVIDRNSIMEHRHYWSKKEIYDLATQTGFKVEKYQKFEFGFNQLAVMEHG